MNIPFLNPTEYLNQHPSLLLATIPFTDESTVTSMKFSHSGNYLALGRNNGSVILLDFESRGIIRRFDSHIIDNEKENVISELLWISDEDGSIEQKFRDKILCREDHIHLLRTGKPSEENHILKSSRFLLACSYCNDPNSPVGYLFVWDILNESSKPIAEFKFPQGIITMNNISNQETKILISFYDSLPKILDLLSEETTSFPLQLKKNDYVIAKFNHTGEKIYCGSAKGDITVFDTSTFKILNQINVENGKCIYDIQFTVKGKYFLVNADGLVKVYHSATDAFQYDVKTADMEFRQHYWCGFSGLGPIVGSDADSSFLFGACKSTVYIWSRSQGFEIASLTPIKQRTAVIRIAWHPTKPMLVCSCTDSNLYLYTIPVKDNWSAFAPGFEEVEINDEYIEREDEYDDELVEEEKRRQEKDLDILDDMREIIDIITLKDANEQSIIEYIAPLSIEQEKWLFNLETQNSELIQSQIQQ